jgi:hypothetical protein
MMIAMMTTTTNTKISLDDTMISHKASLESVDRHACQRKRANKQQQQQQHQQQHKHQLNQSVRFGPVEIRNHPYLQDCCITNYPSSSCRGVFAKSPRQGPFLTVDWTPMSSSTFSSVEDYEATRPPRRQIQDLRTSQEERKRILKENFETDKGEFRLVELFGVAQTMELASYIPPSVKLLCITHYHPGKP